MNLTPDRECPGTDAYRHDPNRPILPQFIDKYSELIQNEPHKAFATLKDIAPNRDDLNISGREILSRHEWKAILDKKRSNGEKDIHTQQLIEWIRRTYSERIAEPWVQALGKAAETIDPAVVNEGIRNEDLPPDKHAKNWAKRYWPLLAGLLFFIATTRSGDNNHRSAKHINATESNSARSKPDASQERPPQETLLEMSGKPQTSQNTSIENEPTALEGASTIGSDDAINEEKKRDFHTRPGKAAYIAEGSKRRTPSWNTIAQRVEDGILTTNDLRITRAQALIDHWIQSFSLNNSALDIKLRTRHEAQKGICLSLLRIYQQAYKSENESLPTVTLESSRHSGKDSSRGFLAVCRANASGQATLS